MAPATIERTHAMNAMEMAFRGAGVDPSEVRLMTALARFRNAGGTKDAALRCVEAAYALPREGLIQPADKAALSVPSSRQPHDDGAGRSVVARSGLGPDARPSSPQGDGEAVPIAPEGHGRDASPSPSEAGRVLRTVQLQRNPTPVDLAAMKAARTTAANAILKIDGVDLREWTIGQALSAARKKGKEHYVLSVLGGMYKHLPHDRAFRDVATDDVIQSVVKQAEAYGNAA